MASDMRKPMGITILRKQEVPKKLWLLPISDMWGIGKKTVPLLIKHGITTIGDLADAENESKIMTLLGKHTLYIYSECVVTEVHSFPSIPVCSPYRDPQLWIVILRIMRKLKPF